MALERIAAIGHATPVRNPVGSSARRPAAGETIELTFEAAAADELLATTAEGVRFKVAGLGALTRDFTAGDVLLMKVLATTPRLELMLFDTAARPGAQASRGSAGAWPGGSDRSGLPVLESDQAAMRPDQVAWLRQVVWRPPDTAAMASSWRALLLAQLGRQATQRAQPPTSQGLTAPMPADDATLANPFVRAQAVADPWVLAAYAWGGLRVTLRVLPSDPDHGPPPHHRDAAPFVLRLMLDLPGLGGVTVQLQLAAEGVLLDLAAERAEALQPLRNLLPAIVAALARVDLRVLRCRLARGLPNGTSWNLQARPAIGTPAPARALQMRIAPEAALPAILFRAAAEVAAVLSSPPATAPVRAALPPAGA